MKTALIVYLAILAIAAVALSAGVWILFGTGWVLLSIAACLLGFSEIVRRGMTNV